MHNLETAVLQACLLEATAGKPGNVHPRAAFANLNYDDFVRSAHEVAPVLARTREQGVGSTVLAAMQRTRAGCGSNPNLGIVLLLAPLCAVPERVSLHAGIGEVLNGLTVEDAVLAYRAIRMAQPGGLGQVAQQDVAEEPDVTLLAAMRLAAECDLVAAQYAGSFSLVFDTGMRLLAEWGNFQDDWKTAVVRLHLQLLSRHPDSLIARKRGAREAQEASRRARAVLDAGWPEASAGRLEIEQFDRWLRADGNARNPGTTADLVAASLFAAIRERAVTPPSPEQILAHAASAGALHES
jgi:triphosphoribosyl-dephospho-CoA synthase